MDDVLAGASAEDFAAHLGREADTVATVARVVRQLPDSASLDVLAWLQVYRVIDPVLMLQAMMFAANFGALRICGTQDFAADVLDYLKLDPVEPAQRNHDVTYKGPRIKMDILQPRSPEKAKDKESKGDQKPVAGDRTAASRTVVDSTLYDTVRRILHSSMSASESVRKIQQNFSSGGEYSVLLAVLNTCEEHKMYNRTFGNTVIQLLAEKASWEDAFVSIVDKFFQDVDGIHEVYKLKVAGQFLGHAMSARVSLWPAIFPVFDLESSANARIVILALLGELKRTLGAAEVERAVLGLDMAGLTQSELAGAFWEMAGLSGVARAIESNEINK